MKKGKLCMTLIVAIVLVTAFANMGPLITTANAFREYSADRNSGNCADCHGNYRNTNYIPNAAARQGIGWTGGLHNSHRNATDNFLNGNCNACHSGVNRFPVQLGASDAATPFDQSCSGCHVGPGLRNHHELMVGANTCSSCHGFEPIGNEKTPLPPVYTASLGTQSGTTRINNPCNDGAAGRVFEGGFFDVLTVGLDNDGDGLYDQDDPDCAISNVLDELAVDFGSLGLYQYDGIAIKRLTANNPNGLATYANKLVANFPGAGLYLYDGIKWTRLNPNAQVGMCATQNALYVDFGTGLGLYKYNGSWSRINANSPGQMWAVGANFYADFGAGSGLYRFNGTKWQRFTRNDATDLCGVGTDLYIHFAGVGLYKYDGTWKKINSNAPQQMVVVGSDLYVNFGTGLGLYKYDGTTWQRINSNAPTSMAAAGNFLYVHFSGVGLYQYDGTWKKINSRQPQQMVAVGTNMYADFGTGIGLYAFDGLTWKAINPNTAEDMIAVNLY